MTRAADPAALLPAPASASDWAGIHNGFHRKRADLSTPVALEVPVGAVYRASSAPLASIKLRLSIDLSARSGTLSPVTRTDETLRIRGGGDCSPNALLGHGSALAPVLLTKEAITEHREEAIAEHHATIEREKTTLPRGGHLRG